MKVIMILDQVQSGHGTKTDEMVPLTGVKEVIGPGVMMKPYLNEIDASKYVNENNKNYVEQKSMDERLEELYIEEIEKDIIKKVEKKGYKVSMCKVDAKITKNEEETGITKIKLKVEKTGEVKQEENSSIENQIVTQVQKIKKVNTKKIEEDKETSLEKSDIQNLKQFLIEEYEVNEKCLEIN